MKYQCPKCKTVIESSKELGYCVCGGKYETAYDRFNNIIKEADELFGGMGIFDVIFPQKKDAK